MRRPARLAKASPKPWAWRGRRAVAASYPDGKSVMNHYTYCLCGDGCLEEGLSQEAISFAGHQKLNKLILIYDENTSTLDGPTSNTMTEDVKSVFSRPNGMFWKSKTGMTSADRQSHLQSQGEPCLPESHHRPHDHRLRLGQPGIA
jgi:pyruvate dehydrogenase complex dehydrogenase (E1) component